MLGNCATGSARMVREPTSTRTMEITMATMGRLIKNFDIRLPSLGFRGIRLGVYHHARTHLLHALGNHAFALLQALSDNPLIADAVAHLDRANAHFAFAVHHRDLIAALQLRNCTLRDKQGALLHTARPPHFGIPAGAQNIAGVGKETCDPDRARALIYFAVCEVDAAWALVSPPVGQDEFKRLSFELRFPLLEGWKPPVEVEIVCLADSEIDLDGVDRRNGSDRCAAWVDQGANL